MKKMLLIAVLALGGAGVANAQPPAAGAVPLCSLNVTDECMNPSQAPRAAHSATHHHANSKAMTGPHHKATAKG